MKLKIKYILNFMYFLEYKNKVLKNLLKQIKII